MKDNLQVMGAGSPGTMGLNRGNARERSMISTRSVNSFLTGKTSGKIKRVFVRPDKSGLFVPLHNGAVPDESFKCKRKQPSGGLIEEESATSADTAVSLLANSFMYGLGFTVVIDDSKTFKLIAMARSGQTCLIDKNFATAWEAREYIRANYIANSEGVLAETAPLWTMFYHPEKHWLNKKLTGYTNPYEIRRKK